MASIRLSEPTSRLIKNALLSRAFKDRCDEQMRKWGLFALSAYNECFSEADRSRMLSLPEGWLPRTDRIQVQIASTMTWLYFKGSRGGQHMSEEFKAVGASFYDGTDQLIPNNKRSVCMRVFDGSTYIASSYQKLENEWTSLEKEIGETSLQIQKVLGSVTTLKKLVEIWPEIAEVVATFENTEERKMLLPAVSFEQLNKTLSLPVEKF